MRPVIEATPEDNLPDIDLSNWSKTKLEEFLRGMLRYTPQDPLVNQILKRLNELLHMEKEIKILRNIEYLGNKYIKEHLSDTNGKKYEKKLKSNWWEALNFFFGRSFMRGRRDKLSSEYLQFTIRKLEDYYSISEKTLQQSYDKLKEQKKYFEKQDILKFKQDHNITRGNSLSKNYQEIFKKEVSAKNPIINLLISRKEIKMVWKKVSYKKKIFLGNDEDVMMVLDVLKFISLNNGKQKNIYKYIRNNLNQPEGIDKVYKELKGENFRAISDKIATFIIRDIYLINSGLKIKKPDKSDLRKAFPVDTWVKQVADQLGCQSDKDEDIKDYFINMCEKHGIDTLKTAVGLWYLGYNSLDILINNCLGDIKLYNLEY
ncbi:MAG: hypothetical protein FVQ77_16450 [Cytophagales bacterium]|nr:hypothetical protein [Cytophagales bacterium]